MKKISTYLLSFMSIVFLIGCGSTFQAYEGADTATSTNGFGTGFTAESSLILTDPQRILLDRIKGFDFNLKRIGSESQVRFVSRVTLGCNDYRDFSTDVSIDQFFAGQTVTVGLNNEFLIRTQCVSSSCEDVIVNISEPQGFTTLPLAMKAYSWVDDTMIFASFYHKNYVSVISSGTYNERNACVVVEEEQSTKDRIIDYVKDRIEESAVDKIEDWFKKLL